MPWAVAAMAVSAVANYEQQQENNRNVQRQYNAKNAVLAQGQVQQDANAAKGQDILNSTVSKFQPGQQASDLGDLVTKRTAAINDNAITPSSIVDPTANANAPQVVMSDLANKMAGATAYANQQGGALGKIGATNDQFLKNGMSLNDSGNELGTLSNFAKGDYNVNQAEQNSAYNNARKAANPLWGILSQAGNAASMYTAGGGDIGSLVSGPPSGQVIASNGMSNAENGFLQSANLSANPGVYGPYQT